MSEKPQRSKFKWVEKLKNIKHIEIYITIIFVIVLILIFFSSTGNKKQSISNYSRETTSSNESSITSYISNMETKLEQILSQVQGASNVKVMVTLDMSEAIVKDNIIQTSNFPDIKGVVIVANGVENTTVKMNILKAVQAVIDISSGRIEILSSN